MLRRAVFLSHRPFLTSQLSDCAVHGGKYRVCRSVVRRFSSCSNTVVLTEGYGGWRSASAEMRGVYPTYR